MLFLPYASSTALTIPVPRISAQQNGPLQANNGLVSATTSVGSVYGGTGLDSSALTGIAQIVAGTWSRFFHLVPAALRRHGME